MSRVGLEPTTPSLKVEGRDEPALHIFRALAHNRVMFLRVRSRPLATPTYSRATRGREITAISRVVQRKIAQARTAFRDDVDLLHRGTRGRCPIPGSSSRSSLMTYSKLGGTIAAVGLPG